MSAEQERPPQLDPALVNEFVSKAHGDLDEVKRLHAQEPALVRAAWDWGGGDFETGLGAAAHMGNRPIALFLLDNGAALDLFPAAMHAQQGGEQAQAVVELLEGAT